MKAEKVYQDLLQKFGKTTADLQENIPNRKPYLGICYPELKRYANELFKDDYVTFLETNSFEIYELEILQTYIIGKIKDINLALKYFRDFAPYAQEWSVVDSLCQKFVIAKKVPDVVLQLVKEYANINDEYMQRIAAVLILSHFLTDAYVEQSIAVLVQLQYDGYFTKMAVAWAVATLMAKYPEKCFGLLESGKLDAWTQNKAISKMHDSYRVSKQDKEKAKLLRRE